MKDIKPSGRLIKDGLVIMTRYTKVSSNEDIDRVIGEYTDAKILRMLQLDIAYLEMAKTWSGCSRAQRRKVACLVVKDNCIIADGINGTVRGSDNKCEGENGETHWHVLHAEANAIVKLTRSMSSPEGATLYTTFSPCKECSKLILQAGITRVAYSDEHSDTDGLRLLIDNYVIVDRFYLEPTEYADGIERVRIWSKSHCAWWRQDCNGYTDIDKYAGVFELERARKLVSGSPEKDAIEYFTSDSE